MTLEASFPTIYVRCGSGDGSVLAIDINRDGDCQIEAFAEDSSPVGQFLNERDGPDHATAAVTITLPLAELRALAWMVLHTLDSPK